MNKITDKTMIRDSTLLVYALVVWPVIAAFLSYTYLELVKHNAYNYFTLDCESLYFICRVGCGEKVVPMYMALPFFALPAIFFNVKFTNMRLQAIGMLGMVLAWNIGCETNGFSRYTLGIIFGSGVSYLHAGWSTSLVMYITLCVIFFVKSKMKGVH